MAKYKDIVRDWWILKAIGKKYGLEFDREHKYYIGDAYVNNRGEYLVDIDRRIVEEDGGTYKGIHWYGTRYKLEYFDGCFKPFLVTIKGDKE